MSYKTMNRKTFWLVSAFVLSAMLVLSLGYIQAQTITLGQIVKWFDDDGNLTDSVITESDDGNIGIGTTTPGQRLTVQTGTGFPGIIHTDGTRAVGTYVGGSTSGADGGWVGTQSNHQLHFFVNNGQPSMTITTDGNVGIGTTSPGAKLEVITSGKFAVRGQSSAINACAVDGVATATTGGADGVRGQTNSPSGRGVIAVSAGGLSANLGLQVLGRGRATGGFTTGSGAFETDDPLDPANKYLRHAFVGSPDMKNIYDGVVVLDANGEALVDLPEWFEAINRDFRYQLTNIGGFAPVYIAEEISGNRFKIAGGSPDGKVSWQVSGIRKDPYAEKYRVRVEEEKSATEKGLYLHPDVYGQPQTKSVQ